MSAGAKGLVVLDMRMDTNGDGAVSAGDALMVINVLDRTHQATPSAAESELTADPDEDENDYVESVDLLLEHGLF